MVPLQQLFSLVLEQLNEFKLRKGITLRSWKEELKILKEKYIHDLPTHKKKEEMLRNKEVKIILFDPYLIQLINKKNKNNDITQYMNKPK